jgi:CelD/BcsL family acetyltransferase involved in cellulose biosynthesis
MMPARLAVIFAAAAVAAVAAIAVVSAGSTNTAVQTSRRVSRSFLDDAGDPGPATLDLEDGRWLAFVESRPEATPFHHPAWASLLGECYGLRCSALVSVDAGGRITAGLPVVEARGPGRARLVSLPFSDRVTPLGNPSAAADLLERLARLDRSGAGIEVRAKVDTAGFQQQVAGYRHLLPLDRDLDSIFSRFHHSDAQRNVRRAEREGVVVREGTRASDLLDVFYSLHLETRRRQGVPIQPRRFFTLLWDRMLREGLGKVFVAEVDGKPAAAAVFLAWNGTVVYKFGASDRSLLRHRPNHAIFWHAIQWASESGYRVLDFGRTDLDNDGLRRFKRAWGPVEAPLVYSTCGTRQPVAAEGLGRRALAAVIKRSPPSVCRFLGETLYRYAG